MRCWGRDREASKLSRRALRGHVLGLLLAGDETTTSVLGWALVHGARAPGEWGKVRDAPDRHTDGYVTETLRLTPPAWGLALARRNCEGPLTR